MSNQFPAGAVPHRYHIFEQDQWRPTDGAVVEEIPVCIHVNGYELVTIMASPLDQKAMALGFLRSEGFISDLTEVEVIDLVGHGTCVDVWLTHQVSLPRHTIRTSGCGGGLTFDDLTSSREPVHVQISVTPHQVFRLYEELRRFETLYPITRGVHASALCTVDEVLLVAEDVGRHNTMDKLWGKAMLRGLDPEGKVIITTGRISSEMLGKAAKMKVPVIASRTSPTSRSVALAEAWNITIIGYLRRNSLRAYTAVQRISASADFADTIVAVGLRPVDVS